MSEDEEELDEEEGLLETPLDKLEPYGVFKDVLLSMWLFLSIVCYVLFFLTHDYRP